MYKGQDSHVLYNNTTHQQFYSHVKEHLHDHIFSLRGEVLTHKASLSPPLFF